MLGDITVAENIYIACGYTDMRKSIDGLAAVVQEQFHLDPFSRSLFLFCGKRRDRIKVLTVFTAPRSTVRYPRESADAQGKTDRRNISWTVRVFHCKPGWEERR